MNKINSTETEEIRNRLISRNLYTPENEYTISNSKITEAVNSIASLLAPTNSFDFSNSIIGRQLQPQTPLVKIANSMLAKQLQYQIGSNAKRELVPIISFANLFDKNDATKFIKLRKDFSITDNLYQSRALNFVSEITGYQAPINPFKFGNIYGERNSTSQELYNSLGSGQKDVINNLLNKNYYTPTIAGYDANHSSIIKSKSKYFNITFSNTDNYPTIFGLTSTDPRNIDRLNLLNDKIYSEQVELRKTLTTNPNEYINQPATNEDYYGKTNRNSKNISIDAEQNFGLNDFKGITVTDTGINNISIPNSTNELHWGLNEEDTRFNVKTGLLYYTKNLIQALGTNNNIDQTKKQFKNSKGEIIGYNGSPASEVRQHTVADQYNRYGKLIRFIGNGQYDVNENSVINKTVFPKIHPILSDDGAINNKNLFFSIENLAYQINENGDVQGVTYQVDGINRNLNLPLCERGQQNGRLMWFAPYDIQFNETSSANWDSTPIIGRGEPLHSYASTERTGVLSFKMIIDHPKQMNGLSYSELVRFFANGEGGSISPSVEDIDKLNAARNELEKTLIKPNKVTTTQVTRDKDNAVVYYFKNAESTVDSSELGYEMMDKSNQYNIDGSPNDALNINFNTNVSDIISLLRNSNESELIKLEFIGYTSQLAGTEFNETLALERAIALKDHIEFEYQLITGKDFATSNIEVILTSKGEKDAGEIGKLPENINNPTVKQERRASVNIKYNEKTVQIDVNLTADEVRRNEVIQSQINAIVKKITQLSNDCYMPLPNYNDFIPRGWEQNGIFKPSFHSQTPEDFHKRLTFLHQCTRQGIAVSNNVINSAFGRQPVCVLRLGDFLHTQIIMDSINFDFTDSMWDMNPEGMGMQYMIANITMNIKILGGQSLGAPISSLQNALSFNYYANSTYYKTGSIYEMTNSMERQELANIQATNNRNETASKTAQDINKTSTPI
jgi:hypothetical protein